MSDPVTSSGCGTVLSVSPTEPAGQRTPCPQCGATARTFAATLAERVYVSASSTSSYEVIARPLPTLILQSLLTSAGSTVDGELVASVAVPWFDLLEEI